MHNKTISTNVISEVEKAFKTLYVILEQDNADPSDPCYQIHSVEWDILDILRGELTPRSEADMAEAAS